MKSAHPEHQQIGLLDFGSQYTHLISRRLRDIQVFCKIYPPRAKAEKLAKENLIGIILSGGPNSVYDSSAVSYDPALFTLGVPVLGLCYGHQLIGQHFGGMVKPGKVREYGFAELNRKAKSGNRKADLFNGLPKKFTVWMSHGDSVIKLPADFITLGETLDCPNAAMVNPLKYIYGLQFHPEVTHTKDQDKILYNFAIRICKAKQDWSRKNMMRDIVKETRLQAKGKKVFMLVSGGVDSTVAFALLQKTLGKKNVLGLHIDSGLLRKNESREVHHALTRAGFNDLHVVDAEKKFLKRLRGVADPEKKRNIIGETYLDIAESWFKKNLSKKYYPRGLTHLDEMRGKSEPCSELYWIGTANKRRAFNKADRQMRKSSSWLLGQGTIYPDTIESGGTSHAQTIKTHHNRIPRIAALIKQNRVIEPLKNLYKDEVRAVGKQLGIPSSLLNRHPFPGPGLGIMTLCSQKNLTLPRLHLPKNTQMLPIKSTGVQGDQRTYAYPLAVWGLNNWDALAKFSTKITNTYKEINRVVTVRFARQMPPSFRQTPNQYLAKNRLELLREIHAAVQKIIRKEKLYNKIWEFPIILLPIGGAGGGQSVVLRPIASREVMTVTFYRLPQKTLRAIIGAISSHKEIDAIFYDVTNKPPATVQWE